MSIQIRVNPKNLYMSCKDVYKYDENDEQEFYDKSYELISFDRDTTVVMTYEGCDENKIGRVFGPENPFTCEKFASIVDSLIPRYQHEGKTYKVDHSYFEGWVRNKEKEVEENMMWLDLHFGS